MRGTKKPLTCFINMSNIKQQLESILSEILKENPHIFLVDIHQQDNNYEFILDGDELLGIYDISNVSRQLNRIADEQMPEAAYSLDVATPGADTPLKLLRQYPKHIGRSFSVDANELESPIEGKLIDIQENVLIFESQIKEKNKKKLNIITVQIPFENIKKAQIILSFK